MTDKTADGDEFTLNLRIEKLLDEFEKRCRKGNITAIESFLDSHLNEPSEVRGEFTRIAQQYEIDLEKIIAKVAARFSGNTAQILPVDIDRTIEIKGIPQRATRFVILRPHARGGLGQVSIALDNELNRHVALKEILPDHADDPARQERFIQEAEITGQLEHPGIVPVYGMGAYADGRPYYAMRFVEGDSLKMAIEDFHKDVPSGASFTTGARGVRFRHLLASFVAVCQAMHYAHCRFVLHRDLKPDNIMLGPYGETLVVDWGLAKPVNSVNADALEADSTSGLGSSSGSGSGSRPVRLKGRDSFGATLEGSAVGTPAYMSPEQAEGKLSQLGPATDIYSLGATLYALLAGHAPFKQGDAFTILTAVREARFPAPRQLNRAVPAGLNAICLKAMARKASDRYTTARELADDVERFLADEPVVALPESTLTRFSRWARRHRSVVGYAGGSLLLIAVVSTFFAFSNNKLRLEAEKQRLIAVGQRVKAEKLAEENKEIAAANLALAESEKRKSEEAIQLAAEKQRLAATEREQRITSEKLAEFLTGLFYAADPIGMNVDFFIPKANSEKLTADAILQRGQDRVQGDQSLAQSPLAKAQILAAVGDVNRQLGRFTQAEPLLVEALEIRRKELGEENPLTADSMHALGAYYHERGDFDRAAEMYRKAIAIREKIPGVEGQKAKVATLHNLAWMIANDGDAVQAEKLFREVLDLKRKIYGELHRETAFSKMGVAFSLIEQHRMLEVAPLVIAFKNDFQKLEGGGELVDGVTSFAMALATQELAGAAVAESGFRTALASVSRGLGEDNVYTALIHCELGTCLQHQNKLDEAESNFRAAYAIADERVQLQHPRIRLLIERYARLLHDRGKTQEAIKIWEAFLAAQQKRFQSHRYVAEALYEYADFLRYAHRYTQSVEQYRAFLDLAPRVKMGQGYTLDLAHFWIGRALLDKKPADFQGAETALRASLEALKASPPPGKDLASEEAFTRIHLARALLRQNRAADAAQMLTEAQTAAKAILSPGSQADFADRLRETQVMSHEQANEPEKVIAEYQSWIKESETKRGKNDEATLKIQEELARFHEARKEWSPASALRKAALAGREARLPSADKSVIASRDRLARALLESGQPEPAAELLKSVVASRQASDPENWTTFHSQSMLGAALLAMKQTAEAETHLRAAWQGFEKHQAEVPAQRISETLTRLIQLEEALSRPAEAEKWRKLLSEREVKSKPPTPRP